MWLRQRRIGSDDISVWPTASWILGMKQRVHKRAFGNNSHKLFFRSDALPVAKPRVSLYMAKSLSRQIYSIDRYNNNIHKCRHIQTHRQTATHIYRPVDGQVEPHQLSELWVLIA